MKSTIGHQIKQRAKPNDVFYTPRELVDTHLLFLYEYINEPNGVILDPFYGDGAYHNAFNDHFHNPTKYAEIEMDLDFFDFKEKVDYIVSNPPYSILEKVLQHSISLEPKIISYLIGINNLTSKRIEYMNKNGYYLDKVKMIKVKEWYGMSLIVVFKKGKGENCIDFDRVVYYGKKK